MRLFFILLIFVLPCFAEAQNDSVTLKPDSISALVDPIDIDTAALFKTANSGFYNSPIVSGEKTVLLDIEQQKKAKSDVWIFFLLLQLLILLVVLKLAFSNDFENLFRIFTNSNVASQVGRNLKDDVSLSSIILNSIFIISMSVFIRFIVLHFYHSPALENNYSMVTLIFLFTFFFVAKYIALKYAGSIFEITSVVDEYLLNFSVITRTIGICMIPILFILYTSSEKYFNFIFIFSLIILSVGVVMIVIRGLSTSYKLMYSSMYHFLIYICVGEILPIFLFIKLLTKTVI